MSETRCQVVVAGAGPVGTVMATLLARAGIDTVLLDLDGTLLDLAFDNYVWMGRIPEMYAEAHGLSVPEAQATLAPKFRAIQGSLEWYCVEHWSRELQIDIAQLHRDEAPRIGAEGCLVAFVHPSAAHGVLLELVQTEHDTTD